MIDDLVTRGVAEPYRMFTSRAEYRLHAPRRQCRPAPHAARASPSAASAPSAALRFAAKSQALANGEALLREPDAHARRSRPSTGSIVNRDGRKRSAFELLRLSRHRPCRAHSHLARDRQRSMPGIAEQLAVDARYAVYLKRQELDIAAFRKDGERRHPARLCASTRLAGLSTELRQKLERDRPASLGQAARLDGMTPAALSAASRAPEEGLAVARPPEPGATETPGDRSKPISGPEQFRGSL